MYVQTYITRGKFSKSQKPIDNDNALQIHFEIAAHVLEICC